jgi:two-component system sensor histidine kinase CpxA
MTMHRHGIFVKIYLCFWLTVVLVLTTQMVLDHMDESSPVNRMRQLLGSSLGMYGQAVLAYHQAGNRDAVRLITGRFKATYGIDACLLDAAGKRLEGGEVALDVRRAAEQALLSGATEHLYVNDTEVQALAIGGPDGKTYVVVGILEHKKFLPPPQSGNPGMALRIAIVMLISGIVCYLLTRYLVSPLIILRDATRRFAAGELSTRIGSQIGSRKDETSELAHDFDVMAQQIESLMKLQRQLIGDISHELRSPLSRLNVALDLARQKTGPEAEHALNRIEEEAEELNGMIGELLTLTRLESGQGCVEMAPVDLVHLVRDIVRDGDFEAQGSNRGVKLTGYEECVMTGSAELLRRAIENVVRNAIHHTRENTDVEISIMRQQYDQVQITVRDHGPGVPARELATIFRPFYRASASRERQSGGTGLGLAISERAVQLHHGTIRAENAADGGLVVSLTMPLAATQL